MGGGAVRGGEGRGRAEEVFARLEGAPEDGGRARAVAAGAAAGGGAATRKEGVKRTAAAQSGADEGAPEGRVVDVEPAGDAPAVAGAAAGVGGQTVAELTDVVVEVASSCAPVDPPLPAALPRAVVRAAGVVGVDVVDRAGEATGALAGDRRDGAAAEAGAGDVVLGASGWFFAEAA